MTRDFYLKKNALFQLYLHTTHTGAQVVVVRDVMKTEDEELRARVFRYKTWWWCACERTITPVPSPLPETPLAP